LFNSKQNPILKPIKILLLSLVVIILTIVLALFVLPEKITNPVLGATPKDWNHATFWYEPWGKSGVHKGIDIFGKKNTHVVAPVNGVVVFSGELKRVGKVVAILGPKWRVHYVAHLNSYSVSEGDIVKLNENIGLLGNTGNAAGKPPHVHYSIVSLFPLPWLATSESQGWKRMFYINPHTKLISR
jgi:murein DD-endopeptidase MepM/ murein hydrolase activator NlpD|tara:strand:- start:2577 stop:3131 length:555 start_codon:yes stop_codon:yes gene_type:complete